MYIIVKRSKTPQPNQARRLTASPTPAIQPTMEAARTEASRLARQFPSDEFLIFAVAEAVYVQEAPVLRTPSYQVTLS